MRAAQRRVLAETLRLLRRGGSAASAEKVGLTAAAARAADGAAPALEIVDSRFRDWKCGIAAVVADNSFASVLVLASTVTPLASVDLRLEGVLVEHNGRMVGTAAGAAALGHPLSAVAWVANHLGRLGLTPRAGDVVLTGAGAASWAATAT